MSAVQNEEKEMYEKEEEEFDQELYPFDPKHQEFA
jgi:hypothetical protein